MEIADSANEIECICFELSSVSTSVSYYFIS